MAGNCTSADDKLAIAIAAGLSIRDASKQAGVSERTAFRRCNSPQFRERVSALRSEMIERACGALSASLGEATATLRGLMRSQDEATRLRASCKVIEMALRIRETVTLEDRVRDLEERLGGQADEAPTRSDREARASTSDEAEAG